MTKKIEILFVDDLYSQNKKNLLKNLEFMVNCYNIEYAADKEEAFLKIESKQYDLIFADIRLDNENKQDIDGKDVLIFAYEFYKQKRTRLFFYSNFNNSKYVTTYAFGALKKLNIPIHWISKDNNEDISDDIITGIKEWFRFKYFNEMNYKQRQDFINSIKSGHNNPINVGPEVWNIYTILPIYKWSKNYLSKDEEKNLLSFLFKFPRIQNNKAWSFCYKDYGCSTLTNNEPISLYYEYLYSFYLDEIETNINKKAKERLTEIIEKLKDNSKLINNFGKLTEVIKVDKKKGRKTKHLIDPDEDFKDIICEETMGKFMNRLIYRLVFFGSYLFLKLKKTDCFCLLMYGQTLEEYCSHKNSGRPLSQKFLEDSEKDLSNLASTSLHHLWITDLIEEPKINELRVNKLNKDRFELIWDKLSSDEQLFLSDWYFRIKNEFKSSQGQFELEFINNNNSIETLLKIN